MRVKMGAPELGDQHRHGLVLRGTPTFNDWNDWINGYYLNIEQANATDGQETCYYFIKIINGNLYPDWNTFLCSKIINYGD
jgi:hypothetical protein